MIINDELYLCLKVINCGEITQEYHCMHAQSDLKTSDKIYKKKLTVLCAISPMRITKLVEKAAFGQSIIAA